MAKRKKKQSTSPVNRGSNSPARSEPKKKKNSQPSVSGYTPYSADDNTAMNYSEMGDFGGQADDQSESIAPVNEVKIKLPPFMVKHPSLERLMRGLKQRKIPAEFKLCRIGTKVVVRNKSEYDGVASFLRECNAEFFSHDIPSEKPFKVVIRGLPAMEVKEIEIELREHYKLTPSAIFPMTRRNNPNWSFRDTLYLVHFPRGAVSFSALQAVRSLNSIIVRWEKYRGGNRDITQCHRCLNYGHGMRNCNMRPRCGNCGQTHMTSDCILEGAVIYKCTNCGGNHRGLDRQCPTREAVKNIRKHATSVQHTNKLNKPLFKANDFPEQPSTRNIRSSTPAPVPSPAGNQSTLKNNIWSVPLPQTTTNEATTDNGDNLPMFTTQQCWELFINLTQGLRQCKSRQQQFHVIAQMAFQYGC